MHSKIGRTTTTGDLPTTPTTLQAVAELAAAIAGGRAHATALVVVALERPLAAHFVQATACLPSSHLCMLDCASDPYGWGSLLSNGDILSAALLQRPLLGILGGGLQQLHQRLASCIAGSAGTCCIVFDSLGPLLERFGGIAVAQLLHALQAQLPPPSHASGGCGPPSVSSLLAGLHSDLHPPSDLAALEQLAAGSMQLRPATPLERSVSAAAHGREPQGGLRLRLRRRTGRVRAVSQLYCIGDGSGGGGGGGAAAVTFLEPPADAMLTPQAVAAADELAAAAVAAEAAAAADGRARGEGQRLPVAAACRYRQAPACLHTSPFHLIHRLPCHLLCLLLLLHQQGELQGRRGRLAGQLPPLHRRLRGPLRRRPPLPPPINWQARWQEA